VRIGLHASVIYCASMFATRAEDGLGYLYCYTTLIFEPRDADVYLLWTCACVCVYQEGNFKEPRAVAINSQGQILVSDTNNHRIQVYIHTCIVPRPTLLFPLPFS